MRLLLFPVLFFLSFQNNVIGQCDPVIIGSDEFCEVSTFHSLQIAGVWESVVWSSVGGAFTQNTNPTNVMVSIQMPGTYCVMATNYVGCVGESCITVIDSDCIDFDNDGYYANAGSQDPNFDPDDADPCVPDSCSPTCDFDSDGLINIDDYDDDGDNCPDFYDYDACGDFLNGEMEVVVGFYSEECFIPGEGIILVANINTNSDFPLYQIISTEWLISSDGINFMNLNFPNSWNCLINSPYTDTLVLICDEYFIQDFCFMVKASVVNCDVIYSNQICFNNTTTTLHSTTLCPSTPVTCEKVCANSSVTYSVENPDGLAVYWLVEGANDYTINGNEVAVDWKEPGEGNISVSMLPPEDYLNVTCAPFCTVDVDEGELGSAIIVTHSAPVPNMLEYSSDGGVNWNNISPTYWNIVDNLDVGIYHFLIRDNAGNQKECSVEISTETEEVIFPFYIAPSSCTFDDGQVNFRVNQPYCYDPLDPGPSPQNAVIKYYSELIHIESGEIWEDTLNLSVGGPSGGYLSYLPTGNYEAVFTNSETGVEYPVEFYIPCYDGCIKEAEQCVNILPEPRAVFLTDPPAVNDIIELCKAETVQFSNKSTGSTTFIWDFGDGTSSLVKDPVKTFYEPGIYEVQLVARNDCACGDTTSITVQVSDAEVPEIECIGPICQGDSATYYANVVCGNYHWGVSLNGSVLAGGGIADDFVTVLWNSGVAGTVQLQVDGCTG